MGKDDFKIPSTGNKYVDTAIGLVVSAFILGVGIMFMGQFCPQALESLKNNPEATNAMTNLCGIFFQTAPNLLP
jgi:hypothetical protein